MQSESDNYLEFSLIGLIKKLFINERKRSHYSNIRKLIFIINFFIKIYES